MNHNIVHAGFTMSSITIHSLDQDLDRLLRQYAKEEGLSLNQTIKKLLSQMLGLDKKTKKHDLSKYAGTLSDEDFQIFEENTKYFEEIHPGDWDL